MFVKYKVNIMLILGYSPLKSGTKNIFSVKKKSLANFIHEKI